MKTLILMLLAGSSIAAAGCGRWTPGANDKRPALIDLEGREIRPWQDSATKAVALVFVLPDCPIANSYMPELNRLHDAFADRGVRLLVVHVDSRITQDEARKHAAEYQVKAQVVIDSRRKWAIRAGATVTPEA